MGSIYEEFDVLKKMKFFIKIIFLLNIIAILVFYFIGVNLIELLYDKSYSVVFIPIIILLIGNQGMVL